MSEAAEFPQFLQSCRTSLDHSMERFGKLVNYVIQEDEDEMKMKLLETIQNYNKRMEKFTEKLFLKPKTKHAKKRSLASSETSEQVSPKKLKPIPSPLMDLPNEIWMMILSYLPTSDILKNFNLTCKRFHSLAINPCAIKSLKLKDVNESDKYHEIAKLLKRSKTIHELTIENCFKKMNPILAHTLKSKSLKTLEVSSYAATLTKKNIEYMKNSNINALKLKNINLNDDAMKEIGVLETLKSVRISTDFLLNVSELIKTLANVNTRIEGLALVSLGHLRINNLPLRNFLTAKTESLKKLKVICHVTKEDKNNNDEVKWSASPNLEELHFEDFCNRSERTFKLELGLDMPKLTKLVLLNIDGKMLKVFGTHNFPLLERLYLRRGSGAEFGVGPPDRQRIYDILENCPNLKSVKLSRFQVSDPQPADDWHAFLYEVYKNFNVYIHIHKAHPLQIFEEYLKKTDLATFYKYTKLQANYFHWMKKQPEDEW